MRFQKISKSKANLVLGYRAVLEALENDKLYTLYMSRKADGLRAKEIVDKACKMEVSIKRVPLEKMNQISNRRNHQGFAGVPKIISFVRFEDIIIQTFERGKVPFVLILDGITDIRNAGGILRSAETSGVHVVIIPDKNCFEVQTDLIRSSSGAIFNVPMARVKNVTDVISYLKMSGLSVFACTEKDEKNIFSFDCTVPLACVVGSEEKGIHPNVLELCTAMASIPMKNKTGSLNVSVATGILLYEVVRQRMSQLLY